ncbi:hypothetical protein SUGI_0563920 [Cryptomeria japonica]|uniref:bifunctional pinoresinol-lariciresinol reductase 2 n=1 Tax=Cryptomeria japonica TaxID=3369 RepID=UPI002408D180|nr:bifunctional pinoresinol-lariciresinol reductase 2 [Cryptomeria japonica]GLJ28615.1 hypothetical protein SUGI_0563920 [Cryptomeria japonica]
MADTENSKSRVLIIGGTGRLGQRFVRASLACSHPTYVLFRPQAANDLAKVDLLISFKKAGAHLLQGSLDDHESLVAALKQVDVVISAMAGTMVRNDILQQLKLLEAIKEAGNIKRFLPSEFGVDPDRLVNSIEPENPVMIDKRKVRRAIEAAKVPYTYIMANCFAGIFLGGMGQFGQGFIPSTERVSLYGDAKTKVIWVDEDDIASYTIRAIDDPRTENRKVHIRPPANILSQGEVVEIWEKIIGHPLEKTQISGEDWLKTIEGKPLEIQTIISHAYEIFYEGCTTNFEIGADEKEASQLYHDVKYTSVESYLKLYV